ncbi:hypothetical protein [Streptomyces sp. STR69]|uniref:hypothetical protein n=1 Tax=Streptomyces sp. STR69 TaxID=1796942 RepID=UPI0021C85CBC|nr:hypothetical protein [Streptomyces sp. STR69]
MTALLLPAEEWTDASPAATFALFGAGTGAGWVFDAVCDRVTAGAVVRMGAPLGGPVADVVEIIGRITEARPPSSASGYGHAAGRGGRIEIVHDQPWRGRIKLRFDADRGGTRIRLFAELDEAGLEWLMRRRGLPAGRGSSPNRSARLPPPPTVPGPRPLRTRTRWAPGM